MEKELLFKPRIQEADVELVDVGTVRVRGLTIEERGQCVRNAELDMNGIPELSRASAIAARMLAMAMVDPPMTIEEVGEWQKAAPAGEIDAVATKVQELSGMTPGAAKAAYKSARGGS